MDVIASTIVAALASEILFERDPELFGTLDDAARTKRCVFVAGLPGVGKSLAVQQLALIAAAAGRTVHVLQWDVARRPFDRPSVLARYPEEDGVTDPAIRAAVGLWARQAVGRWQEAHAGPHDVLVGETPLIGNRLMSLARPMDDDAETLLASTETIFLIAVPKAAVRAAVAAARERDSAAPRHERERASAAPHLVRSHWTELVEIARRLGARVPEPTPEYDSDIYLTVYRRALRHRSALALLMRTVLPIRVSAQELPGARELVPNDDEVTRFIAKIERVPREAIERAAALWYDV